MSVVCRSRSVHAMNGARQQSDDVLRDQNCGRRNSGAVRPKCGRFTSQLGRGASRLEFDVSLPGRSLPTPRRTPFTVGRGPSGQRTECVRSRARSVSSTDAVRPRSGEGVPNQNCDRPRRDEVPRTLDDPIRWFFVRIRPGGMRVTRAPIPSRPCVIQATRAAIPPEPCLTRAIRALIPSSAGRIRPTPSTADAGAPPIPMQSAVIVGKKLGESFEQADFRPRRIEPSSPTPTIRVRQARKPPRRGRRRVARASSRAASSDRIAPFGSSSPFGATPKDDRPARLATSFAPRA